MNDGRPCRPTRRPGARCHCNYLLRMRNGHGERWSEQAKRRDYRADTGEAGDVCPTRSRRQQATRQAKGRWGGVRLLEDGSTFPLGRMMDPRMVWRGFLPSITSCWTGSWGFEPGECLVAMASTGMEVRREDDESKLVRLTTENSLLRNVRGWTGGVRDFSRCVVGVARWHLPKQPGSGCLLGTGGQWNIE